jgi:hypothetical protein
VILNGSKIDAEDPRGPGIVDKLVSLLGLGTCDDQEDKLTFYDLEDCAYALRPQSLKCERTLQVT